MWCRPTARDDSLETPHRASVGHDSLPRETAAHDALTSSPRPPQRPRPYCCALAEWEGEIDHLCRA